jgi:hypothetical protein
MKKNSIFFLFTCLGLAQGKAQVTDGLFNQQSTKRKITTEQLAALQIRAQQLRDGYQVAGKGWEVAQQFKNGTLMLHRAYFNSLSQVNPLVRSDPRGKAIAALYQRITGIFTSESNWQRRQQLLSADELRYFQRVSDNLLAAARKDLDELTGVLTPGQLQLTDAQRLERLDRIYERMKDKYAFAGSFTTRCRKLAVSRKQAKEENEQLKELYGIK